MRDGDDASCLNLNRAQKPRLLGVNPESLQQRQAFTFAEVAKGLPADKPWLLLKAASNAPTLRCRRRNSGDRRSELDPLGARQEGG